MILALTLANSASYMTAAQNGGERGYADGLFGSLTRSPLAIRGQGSEMIRLNWTTSSGGLIILAMTGDQVSWSSGKSLYVAGNTYAVADASLNQFSGGNTQINWSEPSNPFTVGEDYLVRVE